MCRSVGLGRLADHVVVGTHRLSVLVKGAGGAVIGIVLPLPGVEPVGGQFLRPAQGVESLGDARRARVLPFAFS